MALIKVCCIHSASCSKICTFEKTCKNEETQMHHSQWFLMLSTFIMHNIFFIRVLENKCNMGGFHSESSLVYLHFADSSFFTVSCRSPSRHLIRSHQHSLWWLESFSDAATWHWFATNGKFLNVTGCQSCIWFWSWTHWANTETLRSSAGFICWTLHCSSMPVLVKKTDLMTD